MHAMLLAGDIGGTKTRLGLFSIEAGPQAPRKEETYPSARYPSLEAIIREFLAGVREPIDRACFGVAGPVVHGRAQITNLPWVIDEQRIREELHVPLVRLLNDLAAIASAVPLLGPDDLHTLNTGTREPGGAIAVIAPGTGLGEAFLTWDGTRYRAHPSEGGHADFAPTDQNEVGLLGYLERRLDHVSFERVCSGRGLPNIYAYLKDTGAAEEPSWLREQLMTAPDPTPVIVDAAVKGDRACDLCVATLCMFVAILGAEAGNLALKVLATGGVYLGGGIPPRIVSLLEEGGRFMQAFRRKGRLSDLLVRMPVHVIIQPDVALVGAASVGLTL